MAQIITDNTRDDVVVHERDSSMHRDADRAPVASVGSIILMVVAVLAALYILSLIL